jgi:hypothetical protein
MGLMTPVFADQCCCVLEVQCPCNGELPMLDSDHCHDVSLCDAPPSGSHFMLLLPTFDLKVHVQSTAVREIPVKHNIQLVQEVEEDSYELSPPPLFVNLSRCSLPPPKA